MSKPCPAVDQALDYLRLHFTKEKLRPGQRLPTVREIARCAGVSPPTLCKALAVHREREQLSVSPRRGITVPGHPADPAPRPINRAEEVVLRFTRDIATGRYAKHPFLPSGKELQEIYGTGFATMALVLDRLIARGIIFRYRRRHGVRTTRGTKAELTILLIVSSGIFDQIEKFGFVRTRIYPLLHAMEEDCIRRNIRLTILPSPSFLGLAGRPASAAAGRAWDSLPDGGSIRPLVIDEGGRQDLLGACGFLVAVPTPGLRDFVAVFGKS